MGRGSGIDFLNFPLQRNRESGSRPCLPRLLNDVVQNQRQFRVLQKRRDVRPALALSLSLAFEVASQTPTD